MSGLFGAKAQSVVHPKAYYDAITYEWTDANGVTYTNSITDEATNPYQIIALLKKVYCDPNIPGPKFSAYKQNGQREREVYYGAVDGGWDISASDVTPPYEDGYTILMVALNNTLTRVGSDTQQQTGTSGWLYPQPTYGTFSSNFFTTSAELVNYIRNNVASVQLLTDGLRIGEGTLAGTTFNISGNYNRFFIIGKGQAREKDEWVIQQENSYAPYEIIAGERVPFKQMFEQFSPTDGSDGSQITDFYAKMVGGKLYPVLHDCASVIEVEHEFSMAGKNGTEYKSLTGMNVFIPDYRLMYWENQYTYSGRSYTVDGRTLNPYKTASGTSFNNNNRSYLCANYGNYNQDYAPKLGIYLITLEGKANEASAEHTYDVVLDWTSSLDELSGSPVAQNFILYLVTTDEDGNEVNSEIITTQESTYTYQVPQDEHSYTLTYIVFGKPADGEHDVFVAWSNEASVIIPGWNDFLSLSLNHYESDYVSAEQKNYYRNYLNLENEDMLNALTPTRVQEGENQFMLYRYDAATPDTREAVALLQLTNNNGRVSYTIAYENQDILAGSEATVKTEGNLGNYGADDAINLGDITFVDQFNASTAENTHPNRYGYVLALYETEKTGSTNSVEVPVFKTTSAIDGYYTLAEIEGDVDAMLPAGVKNANVQMTLSSNPSIYYYTLERGSNANPNEPISKIQRRTDGTYQEMLNELPQYFNQEYEPGLVNRLDNKVVTGYYNDFMSYEPVIWTFGEQRKGENSYGSPIWRTGVAEVTGAVKGTRSTTQFGEWRDEQGNLCCFYNPFITVNGVMPTLNTNVTYEPYMYRVWRICDDVRGYKVDPETHVPSSDPLATPATTELIIERVTDDLTIQEGSEFNGLSFGATTDAQIQFKLRCYYKKVGDNRDGNAPEYYVVESMLDWTDMTTGLLEINGAVEVSKTYINAQGVSSDKPFSGVNIVVTTFSDGSTTTSKVVRR
jgi:hypothetical protein